MLLLPRLRAPVCVAFAELTTRLLGWVSFGVSSSAVRLPPLLGLLKSTSTGAVRVRNLIVNVCACVCVGSGPDVYSRYFYY